MDKRLKDLGISEEALQRLRDEHGRIWLGSIRVGPQEIVFAWREPRHTDADLWSTAMRGKPAQAHRNLLAAIIVAPDRQEVLDALRPYPLATGQFVSEQILPLLGSDAETETREI